MNNLCRMLVLSALLFGCKQEWFNNHQGTEAKTERSKVIQLMPYEGFDTSFLPFLQKEIESFYGFKVTIIGSKNLPAFAFYKPRKRYKADSLLVYQERFVTDRVRMIIGLTKEDISSTKASNPDYAVFGLGFKPGTVSVVSTCRMLWRSKSANHVKERLLKVVLHEIGHNLGLPHCTKNTACLMTAAGGTIKQIDRELKWICDGCSKQLQQMPVR